MRDREQPRAQNERIRARDAMALDDFWNPLESDGSAADHVFTSGNSKAHVDHQRKAGLRWIHRGVIAGDDARFFHPAHAFGDRRSGEADSAAKFRKRNAGILLQKVQNAPAYGIE